jgi:hypothetical protein
MFISNMDSSVTRLGPARGVVRQHDAEGVVTLAVGIGVVGRTVIRVPAAVRMNLTKALQAVPKQVLSRRGHVVAAHPVIAGMQVSVGHGHSRCNGMFEPYATCDGHAIEVSDPFKPWLGLGKPVQ